MSLKRSIVFFFSAILAFTMFFSLSPSSVLAEEPEGRTVRVAFPIQAGLTEIDEKGVYSGYTYEYLQEIAQYTGWKYEFVQAPGDINQSITTLMDMLKNGEIDLLGSIMYSEDLTKEYDYSAHSCGSVETVLQVLADSDNPEFGSLTSDTPLRIAILKKAEQRNKELAEYCSMNQITPQLVEYESQEQQYQALQNGEVDAMLNVSLNTLEGLRTVAWFSPRPFYFISGKGNSELMQQLNTALFNIQQSDPYYSTTLSQKYFPSAAAGFRLSQKEQEYISTSGTLRVGIPTGKPPFQYVDSQTGALRGISVDLLSYLSNQTGLQFEFIEIADSRTLEDMLTSRKLDLVAGFTYSYELAQHHKLAMTRPYLSTQYVLLLNENVQEDSVRGKRLALPSDFIYDGTYIGKVQYYDSIESCIQAVNSGKADYTYVASYIAQYYVNQPGYTHMKMVSQASELYRACIGVVQPINSTLLGILNKAIINISEENLQSIIFQNTTYRPSLTVGEWVRRNPLPFFGIICSFFILVILLLVCWLWSRVKANRKYSLELKKHLQVYSLASELFFEYDYRSDSIMISGIKGENGSENTTTLHYASVRSHKGDNTETILQKDKFIAAVLAKQSGSTEQQCLCPDGNMRWLRFTMQTICDKAGDAVYTVGKITDIDQERKKLEELQKMASHDSLTHLLNAEAFRRQTASLLADHSFNTPGGILAIIDIDRFKHINDTYGHPEGDRLLVQVAQTLKSEIGPLDLIGRLGGDEFSIYFQADSKEVVEKKCSALCESIRSIQLPEGGVSISIGAACRLPKENFDALYHRADRALYDVKERGRDNYRIVC